MKTIDKKENIKFILTARIPDFDWLVERRLGEVSEKIKKSIIKFVESDTYKYILPYFNLEEIKEFFIKYKKISVPKSPIQLQQIINDIFAKTRGHPLMVKFSVLGQGLEDDVKTRYEQYLSKDEIKVETMIACSLLDIANIPITDNILEKMNLLTYAYDLKDATLYRVGQSLWKTIHPRWAIELIHFLYSETDANLKIENKRIHNLKKVIKLFLLSKMKI